MVAFLLTDIEGSTRLWQEHRSAMRSAIDRHDQLLVECIAQHGGRVLTTRGEGDSLFAVFGRASDAVTAASAIQRAIHAEAWPEGIVLRVRIAINTGESGTDFRGMAVNRCARLRGLASGGQVLVSQATQALVRDELPHDLSLADLGEYPLRDLAIPERIFQLNTLGLPGNFPPIRAKRPVALPPWWVLGLMTAGLPLPLAAAVYQWSRVPAVDAASLALNLGVTVAALGFLAVPAVTLLGLAGGRGWAANVAVNGLLAIGTVLLVLGALSLSVAWSSDSGFKPGDAFEAAYALAAIPLLVVHLAAAGARVRRHGSARLLVSLVSAFWILRYAYGLTLGVLVLWFLWTQAGTKPASG
jgi:class 3 adenylate cyclase